MARFNYDFDAKQGAAFRFTKEGEQCLSIDELLEVLRPAALHLKNHYRTAILRIFKRRTGSFADSIDIDDNYRLGDYGYASIRVAPVGKHKGGRLLRKSRAGPTDRKYAKHNRRVSSTALTNAELGYLLEFGTPRIDATHWMENANEIIEDELQTMIVDEFTTLLKKKGLIE